MAVQINEVMEMVRDLLTDKLSGKKYNEFDGVDYEFKVTLEGSTVKVIAKAWGNEFVTDTIAPSKSGLSLRWKGYEGACGNYKCADGVAEAVLGYWSDAGIVL